MKLPALVSPLICTLLLLAACGARDEHSHSQENSNDHSHDQATAEVVKGPHNGRLLVDGDIAVEIAIFESGVPPEFHVWVTQGGKPMRADAVQLSVELTRLGGKIERFAFAAENDYLKGDGTVVEPHSFDVKVTAVISGKTHAWTYESHEGRTTIAAPMAAAAGIKTAVAGPGVLRETLALRGRIAPNAERVRSVVARFPGPIRSVAKQLGDNVNAGAVLATVESNESLQTYTVTAPIAGTITQRRANVGEGAGAEALFEITDYGTVWAELTFFAKDRARIHIGQRVDVSSADGELTASGVIAHIAPAANQTLVARINLDNADVKWTPGLFVDGTVTLGEIQAPLVVANTALQTFRDFTVVFAQVNETYEVRMLEIGRSDGAFTEVLSGLDAGTTYVTQNSYLIKADIEKSGASHDH